MLTGEIEAIDGVSTQSPQDKEPRAKAIARVHEQPRMALRKAWGTSGCLIALFEPREKLGSWSALPLGEPRLQMARRGDWLRPRGSQNNAEVGSPHLLFIDESVMAPPFYCRGLGQQGLPLV
jgi:hypothetical protein